MEVSCIFFRTFRLPDFSVLPCLPWQLFSICKIMVRLFRKLFFILFCFFVVAELSLSTGCANIIPPTGGPRDSLPPVLMNVSPRDSTLRFDGNKITFTFDEFVDIKDAQKDLIVSPLPKVAPTTEAHLRTLTIKIRDTLKPNTTYSFDFGKSVRDINEGNILRNFSYVFSTGRYIDSLSLSGTVLLAATGKTDSTLSVMLHTDLTDSAVVKQKPRYVARVDSTGHFQFRFLAPGKYAIYTIKDEGGSYRYLSRTTVFGFSDSAINLDGRHAPVNLFAYAENPETKAPAKKTTGVKKKPEKDKEKDKRLGVTTSMGGSQLGLLDTLYLIFSDSLKLFDSTKVHFSDLRFKPLTGYHFVHDTTGKKIAFMYPWVPETGYHLVLEKDFAQDTTGKMLLKADTLSFQTKRETDYAISVKIQFGNLDMSKRPVLLFLQADNLKYSYPLTKPEFSIGLFNPGDYQLAILYDTNRNGKWDPGEFLKKHRQPEIVVPIKRKITVKAAWDNEININL